MRWVVSLFVAVCGIACSDPPAPIAKDDAAVMHDAAPVCTPLGECEWLDAYQKRIVAALSGQEDISPGVKLAHRASITERSATRAFLRDELIALGLVPVAHDYMRQTYTGSNVLATLDATGGTGGTIIVGAHFDSVPAGPGAADNATGVAIVLSLARYLKTAPLRQHPVIFALFDQEELGLVGSRAYVATLTAGTVTSAHVFDMISYDGDGDHAVELWSPAPALEALYVQHGAAAGIPIQPVTFALSDHQAFVEASFPAVGVSEEFAAMDHTPDYHKATDTYDKVNFEHLSLVTHLVMAVVEADVAAP